NSKSDAEHNDGANGRIDPCLGAFGSTECREERWQKAFGHRGASRNGSWSLHWRSRLRRLNRRGLRRLAGFGIDRTIDSLAGYIRRLGLGRLVLNTSRGYDGIFN